MPVRGRRCVEPGPAGVGAVPRGRRAVVAVVGPVASVVALVPRRRAPAVGGRPGSWCGSWPAARALPRVTDGVTTATTRQTPIRTRTARSGSRDFGTPRSRDGGRRRRARRAVRRRSSRGRRRPGLMARIAGTPSRSVWSSPIVGADTEAQLDAARSAMAGSSSRNAMSSSAHDPVQQGHVARCRQGASRGGRAAA